MRITRIRIRDSRCVIFLLAAVVMMIAACTPDDDIEAPTQPPDVPTLAPSLTASPTITTTLPQITPSATFPPTITPTLTATPAPPTSTPLPTGTPGPFEHTVRPGDDCIGILYEYGHTSLDALQVMYQLNDLTGCVLPAPGEVIQVPRPTPLPGVTPADVAPVATSPFSAIFHPDEYCAGEGDTLTSIALKTNTTLRKICELNPLPDGLDCRGCDFSQSDVGFCPNPPVIREGQCVTVPGATPFPTGTAPPTGNETATPTPTHRAPDVVYPQNGAAVSGLLRLQWVSVGFLQPDEFYVVNLLDETTGAHFINDTKSTFLDVPLEYVPVDGQAHQVKWWVSVEARTEAGLFVPIGGRTADYQFTWE